MIDKETEDLIIRGKAVYYFESGHLLCNKFTLDCLELIEHKCPPVAQKAIAVASQFWSGNASAKELEASRVECWNYLDKKKASVNPREKEYCMIRAVICSLYPNTDQDDLLDGLVFFVEMLYRVGNYQSEVKNLLKIHFQTT